MPRELLPTWALKEATKLGVIADDLTGANDTGVQFTKHGLSVMVVLDTSSIGCVSGQADVLVVDTDSRWSDPRTAYGRVREAAEALKKAGMSMVYKKIDSTLRGNVGTEIDAVMDVFQAAVAFVVPAFPATGRVTVDGKQLLRSVPLDRTEVASDILTPVTESHVPTLLARQTRRKVGHVPLEVVKAGVGVLKDIFWNRAWAGEQVIVVDASEQEDLQAIAAAIASVDLTAVMVGSAGLAVEVPRVLGMTSRTKQRETRACRRGVLVIGGSASPTARAQLEYAVASLELPTITVRAEDILSTWNGGETRTLEVVRKACSTLARGDDLMLFLKPQDTLETPDRSLDTACNIVSSAVTTSPMEDDSTADAGRRNGNEGEGCQGVPSSKYVQDSRRITSYLGAVASKVLRVCDVVGLVLTGGDTAAAVCKALGAIGVALLDEIVPGVPSGRLVGGPHAGLMIVTKAGSFGGEDVIARAIRYLHHGTEQSGGRQLTSSGGSRPDEVTRSG